MVKPISSLERRNLVDNYLTELSLLAKGLCPDARIEATTEAFEDEDGHVRIYAPAEMSEEEIAVIEESLQACQANREVPNDSRLSRKREKTKTLSGNIGLRVLF